MTTTKTIVTLFCDTCDTLMSEGRTEKQAIEKARSYGDAVDTDYVPAKTMCRFCKIEWRQNDTATA